MRGHIHPTPWKVVASPGDESMRHASRSRILDALGKIVMDVPGDDEVLADRIVASVNKSEKES